MTFNTKEFLGDMWIVFCICLSLWFISSLAYLFISQSIEDKNDLTQCGNYYELDMTTWKGTTGYDFTTKDIDDNHFACCKYEKIIVNNIYSDYNCTNIMEKSK